MVDVINLSRLEAYLREEADFNRSWIDGRRQSSISPTEQYKARCIELAEEREAWADAIAEVIATLSNEGAQRG